MQQRERLGLWLSVVVVLVMTAWASVGAEPLEATISLGRDPEPPMCVLNPGGTVDITWDIEHTTTPNYVYYKLEDPTRTIIYEDSTYPGSSGITIARQWTVPAGAPDGKYWVRLEYWSFEAGNEANAEVTFYVCSATGDVCADKWEDKDCNEELTVPEDDPVGNWWICLETPLGDTYCKQTDVNGTVCWTGLPLGDYRVYEVVPGGWVAIYPESYNFTLDEFGATFTFFNKIEGASATEQGTLGSIKAIFR
jgi:hypothetical protein